MQNVASLCSDWGGSFPPDWVATITGIRTRPRVHLTMIDHVVKQMYGITDDDLYVKRRKGNESRKDVTPFPPSGQAPHDGVW